MNLRRWLTPGHRGQALAAGRVPRPAPAGARLRSPDPPGRAGTGARRACRDVHRSRDPAVPAVPVARPDRRVDRRRSPRRRRLPGHAEHDGPPAHVRRRSAARRGHLPEAVPGPRTAHRDHRWRDRAVHAPARPQGTHEQPHRGRDRGRRRRLVRCPPHGARDPARRRHPQLHRRPGGRGAVDERAAPVPIPRRRCRCRRLRMDPDWPATRSATSCWRR